MERADQNGAPSEGAWGAPADDRRMPRLLGLHVKCRSRARSPSHAAPFASATENAPHLNGVEPHGLRDTLDRIVAADQREFRGDIAQGGSL
jgi:hypothetical protein